MSDHWEQYPRVIGENLTFVMYDHGIHTELEQLPLRYCARFDVTLKVPDERGLPQADELGWLNEVEDELALALTVAQAVLVGRTTANGHRVIFFYTTKSESAARLCAQNVAVRHGYQIKLTYELDSSYSHYWNELFPTDDDWRVIQDLSVENSLWQAGDLLTQPREIEHWAYFHTTAARWQFVEQVRAQFDQVDFSETPNCEMGAFTAKLTHTGLPDHRSIGNFTRLLNRAAKESGGHYDGWETLVCR
jgi:hypothetical protein